ncbi:PilN domain-containing protein [Legionella maioricensis]|uniref:PilN domain-containing protein n=1 Tax=Legionella maioricensis TaxID=2896528 RepID=A0A9X2D1N0_9GAMM|nr:PilN domain-containing protein [Legionella maioricensis]MCL9684435.1 PilN domain-containing protein [Legionella maioricensis]MCL9687616.1 PilN domain-containing protein [Legionella maioricensis]
MTQINLLPWREQKREQEKKVFTTILIACAIFAAFIVFIVNYYASELVSYQVERNQILQKEINSLEDQIKEIKALKQIRQALISRMSIVQNLQSTRTLMVHLFDELIKILPPGIYVTKLERKNDMVTLWGYSESNTNISILMRNIESNAWIQNPSLTEIKKMDDEKQPANNEFKLSFILKPKY